MITDIKKKKLLDSTFSGATGHLQGFVPFEIDAAAFERMKTFKSTGKKDDPARTQGIHGPYEELMLRRTGKLPPGYYSEKDPQPWGMRPQESRSNILWQVLSGIMDRHPEFATNYLALALDSGLGNKEYKKELKKLNGNWGDYLDNAGVFRDHVHSAMKHTYDRVACPACTMLTSLACEDKGMRAVFQELLPLNMADRRKLLVEKGLMPLLDMAVPVDDKPKFIPGR